MYRKYACILLFSAGVASMALGQEPVTTTTCQLQAIPFAYDHKIVRVAGFISHDFEDFTLFDPFCPTYSNVWLDYGGKVNSETMYCACPLA